MRKLDIFLVSSVFAFQIYSHPVLKRFLVETSRSCTRFICKDPQGAVAITGLVFGFTGFVTGFAVNDRFRDKLEAKIDRDLSRLAMKKLE